VLEFLIFRLALPAFLLTNRRSVRSGQQNPFTVYIFSYPTNVNVNSLIQISYLFY